MARSAVVTGKKGGLVRVWLGGLLLVVVNWRLRQFREDFPSAFSDDASPQLLAVFEHAIGVRVDRYGDGPSRTVKQLIRRLPARDLRQVEHANLQVGGILKVGGRGVCGARRALEGKTQHALVGTRDGVRPVSDKEYLYWRLHAATLRHRARPAKVNDVDVVV